MGKGHTDGVGLCRGLLPGLGSPGVCDSPTRAPASADNLYSKIYVSYSKHMKQDT